MAGFSTLLPEVEIVFFRRRITGILQFVLQAPHRYGNSRAIWDHIVLPATQQRWHSHTRVAVLPSGVMVRASDLQFKGHRLNSWLFNFQVTTLGKLFTHLCPCHQAVQIGTSKWTVPLCGWEGKPWQRVLAATARCAHYLRVAFLDQHPPVRPFRWQEYAT